jgi:hypothetical protein
MRLGQAVRAALLLACCAASTPAWADSPAATLSWQAPSECPQAAAFTAQVEHFLGQKLDAARAQSLHISGEVMVAGERGYVARLRLEGTGAARERELSHRDCTELAEAAALVTALAIDPTLTLPEDAPQPESLVDAAANDSAGRPLPAAPAQPPLEAPVEPSARPTPPSLKDSLPVRPAGPSIRAAVAAVGLVGNAVLPGVGVGVGARARLERARFGVSLRADYWLPRSKAVGDGAAGIELGAWGVGLRACGVPLSGRVALALCGGGSVGDMYGAGNDLLTNPRTRHRRWSALEAELELSVLTLSNLATCLGVTVGKTLERPQFGVSEDGRPVEVFKPSAWSVVGFVGLSAFR